MNPQWLRSKGVSNAMNKRLRLPLNLQLFAEDEDPEEPKTYTQEDVDALTAKIADLTKKVKWQTLEKLGLSREEIEYAIEHIDADNEQGILAAISEFGDDLPVLVRVKQLQQQQQRGVDPNLNNGPSMRPRPVDLGEVGRKSYYRLKESGKLNGTMYG